MTPTPVIVRAEWAEVLADGPTSRITLLAEAGATGGAFTANRAELRRGSPGAPPHHHRRMTESLHVLDGTLRVLIGEEIVTLGKGDLVVIPPLLAHAFAPPPGEEAELLAVFTPGTARFDYYRLLERLYRGEATARELVETAELYDNHYVDSPRWRESL